MEQVGFVCTDFVIIRQFKSLRQCQLSHISSNYIFPEKCVPHQGILKCLNSLFTHMHNFSITEKSCPVVVLFLESEGLLYF